MNNSKKINVDSNKTEEKEQPLVIFVSGNTDISEQDFMNYYFPVLQELIKNDKIYFVLSDEDGCAVMTQLLFNKFKNNIKKHVSIFGIGDTPKNYVDQDYLYIGGFTSIEERDAAMTAVSTHDLHVVLNGKGRTAVSNNILRRLTPNYNYEKYISEKYNFSFWDQLFKRLKNNE